MWKKSKVTDPTAMGQAVDVSDGVGLDQKGIKRKSKVPGVMITQFVEELPEGMTTPDFTRKPIALTLQEGKHAVFKAIIVGTPTPTVSWSRANGEIFFHPAICQQLYDEIKHEHTLEFPKVAPEDADTYKCFATNEYGRAICTVVLNVIEVGFNMNKETQKILIEDASEVRKRLKKRTADGSRDARPMEPEDKVWEILLSADKKDYERICAEYGITDFRGMLRKLTEMKREREEEIAEFVSHINNLKHIEVKDNDCATIELDMDLRDPGSKIFLYKDGIMVPYTIDDGDGLKHNLKQVGKKFVFTIKKLSAEDAGLYSVDIEGVNVFSTEFKVPEVEFAVKIAEVRAEEREDAMFQCVLTAPIHEVKWFGKNAALTASSKHEIIVSEDKLIHKLIVRDCMPLDAGIYAAVVGIKSCNAWLIVEANKDGAGKGKKTTRKTTMAGCGGDEDLRRIAKEQQEKYHKEMDEKLEAAKKAQAEREAAEAAAQAEADAAAKATADAKAAAMAAAKDTAQTKKAEVSNSKAANATKQEKTNVTERSASIAFDIRSPENITAGKAVEHHPVKALAGTDDWNQGAKRGSGGNEAGDGGIHTPKGATAETHPAGGRDVRKHVADGAGRGTQSDSGPANQRSGGVGVEVVKVRDGAAGEAEGKKMGEDSHRKREDASQETTEAQGGEAKKVESDEDLEERTQAKKRVRVGPLVQDTVIGGNKDDEFPNEEGGKPLKTGKHPEKNSLGAKVASVADTEESAENGESADGDTSARAARRSNRSRHGLLLQEAVGDQGVHFHAGLSDCKANVGESAELECKLSKEDCQGNWYKDGTEIKSSEGITITKDGSVHRLKIHKVTQDHAGKYRFEADGRKTEAVVAVEDPPRFGAEDLEVFKAPITVKKGHKANYSVSYVGGEPFKVQWYLEGEELSEDSHVKIDNSEGYTTLLLLKLQRKDTGEIKLRIKNEFGTAEAFSQLVVLDKPSPPLGPLEIIEGSSSAVEFKWRPPKDNGGCKIANYILERQQIGRNTWKKVGPIGPEPTYRDTDVDHGRRYCYRIRVETEMGISEQMETEDIQAGTKAYPAPPSAPKVVSAFKDCISLTWAPPANTGGTDILGYNLEKRKKGSNLWGPVNPPEQMIRVKSYAVKDVVEGIEYEFRVSAINNSGAGEFSTPSEFVFARDPKKPPGKVLDLKVTDSTYTTLTLSWAPPKDNPGVEDEAKGYFVEIRPAQNPEWDSCNTTAITMNTYTVKGLKSLAMYWVRVIAVNDGGAGEAQELNNYILAMPPPVRPRFTDTKITNFMVVRAGNSARFNINFVASPWPEITWLKDGAPVSKRVTISNTEGTSQLLITSAERADTGIYTIVVKNIVGQETYSIEIRVTDEPKPPGPVELDENVPGTVTISWTASPDEKRDDRLHYMVTKRDSHKRTWHTVADSIFNNRFTACNIMPGREYQFRVYAKNDMGSSNPSESPKWLISGKKEKFQLSMPEVKPCDLQVPPEFLVPLKLHTAPQGYECYMSCAVKGDPKPHVTWYRNNISLNTNTNYYISNTCGVCSMLILRAGSKDTGEYKVVAENALGRVECSTKLTVRE